MATSRSVLALVRHAAAVDRSGCAVLAVVVLVGGMLPVPIAVATGAMVDTVGGGSAGSSAAGSSAAGNASAGNASAGGGAAGGGAAGGWPSHPGSALIWIIVGLAVGLLCLQLAAALTTVLAENLGRRVADALKQQVIRAVLDPASSTDADRREVVETIRQARGIGTNITPVHLAATALAKISLQRLQALTSGVLLIWFDPLAGTVVTVAYFALITFLAREYHDEQRAVYGESAQSPRAQYLRNLALTGEAAKEIRVFGLADWLEGRHAASWHTGIHHRRFGRTTWVILAAVLAAGGAHAWIYVRLGEAAASGRISAGELVTYGTAVAGVLAVLTLTMDLLHLSEGTRAIPAVDRLGRQLGTKPATSARVVASAAGPQRLGEPERTIVFEDVGFRYPNGDTWVLRHLDLRIRRGQTLAIIGFNGAGKTTLIKLLCGLQRPTEGRITVDGTDLSTLDPRSWQRHCAVVFQDFNRYPVSLGDNIRFGAPGRPADDAEILDIARRAGLPTVATGAGAGACACAGAGAGASAGASAGAAAGASAGVTTGGLGVETVLSRRYPGGVDLSGGQWQRLAVARAINALRAGATWLIMDEPTSALDVRAEASFYDEVMEQLGAPATILISHRFATVRKADRIVTLDQGRICQDGTHEELMRAGGLYATMFSIQAERFDVG